MASSSPGTPARVLLVRMPRLLHDIVTSVLSAYPDIQVVGELPTWDRVEEMSTKSGADVVVVDLSISEVPGVCERLLRARPHMRILGIAAGGRRSVLYEWAVPPAELGELSPDGLAAMIHRAP